jgi:hypothetical protein
MDILKVILEILMVILIFLIKRNITIYLDCFGEIII